MSAYRRIYSFLVLSLALHAGILLLPASTPSKPEKEMALEVRLESVPPVPAPPMAEQPRLSAPPRATEPRVKAPPVPETTPAQLVPTPVPAPPSQPANASAPVALPASQSAEKTTAVETPVIFDAAYLRNPPPDYPMQSRRLEEEGVVKLLVRVSPEGVPMNVELAQSSGFKRLDTAAQEAVRQWHFVPAKRNGQAVSASVIVPLRFRLNE